MDRELLIEATRSEWSGAPFAWSRADCFMSAFNYVRVITGIDGGAEWRGTYDDEAGALATLSAAGGGLAGFAKGMAIAGVKQVGNLTRGDVVVARIGEHDVAGLCLGDMIMFRLLRGAVEIDPRHVTILGVWRP